ncbi:putative helicase mov-10-B.1 [Copidosoma floridanum]|uniref:putative helicase mov-10-B.1 n=1 Tax=Copidosoma floridanum TaxID=29053 RepID=UPI0006C9470B|nr:putative helicase mov-10-B.1 [Copidosoma floridanum]XP_014214569.1 putative helicase mov-10-B.1 [Copidosoma floridanum]XP_014214577.1 putative helicase mov-10-B.1 [Copidosoma floridanum]XP_014214586.1 putative helicase mov-10-B.1 [Copidosoma floridanum]
MAPSKVKNYCNKISKNEFMKKTVKNKNNFFVLPPRVILPKYPIPNDLSVVVWKNLKPFPGMTERSEQFLRILTTIKNGKYGIQEDNYLEMLKLMLYVETIQNQIDMKRYDQLEIKIERVSASLSDRFKIYVQGLGENRPSIRPEDEIEVRGYDTKVKYVLRIINVASDYILVAGTRRFTDDFDSENLYDIRFRGCDYTTKCSHYAVSLTKFHKITPYFFPKTCIPFTTRKTDSDFWFNESIKHNPQQKQAVLNIIARSSRDAPYILYGPPGTGKTATLVEAICQIFYNSSCDTHVLVCTPSNSAADEITKRLLKYIDDENSIHRMYSPSKEGSTIDTAIVGCSNYVDGQVLMLPADAVKEKSIILCTLCAVTRLLFMGFRDKHFSYIFIDEAGQATEPDSLIPFNLLTSQRKGRIGKLHGQVIIAGDPNQLGPSVMSRLAEPILGRSLLERLMDCEPYRKNENNDYNPSFITKLVRNYRSHPDIIRVSNTLFYDDELRSCGNNDTVKRSENWYHLARKGFPIIFHGVEGVEQKEIKSPSIFNTSEVEIVIDYVMKLVGKHLGNSVVKQSDIGIITPFTQQKLKLKNALAQKNFENIDVGTVELFQGQEKDIIIMSTVRSKIFKHDERYHIGFLSNPKRFNVALTRAKALLIVIGDPNILKVDSHWRYFLKFCQSNGACKGIKFLIQESLHELSYEIKYRNKKQEQVPFNCNLGVINIDDGVPDSEDSENEEYYSVGDQINNSSCPQNYNGASNHYYNTPRNTDSASNSLFDIIIQKFQELNINDSNTKKKKKPKKKSRGDYV